MAKTIPTQSIDLEKLQEFGGLELLANQVVEGFIVGMHKSPFHGFSVEFAEHKQYNQGESTRHIDWKLYGRTDKLFLKKYEEETNLRCQIIIDTSSSMYFPDEKFNKMTFSVYCAAAIIQLLKKQRDAVGLSIFSDEVKKNFQAKSNAVHIKMLFNELELALRNKILNQATNASKSLELITESIHRRSLVVIFSDMMEGANATEQERLFSALQHLKYKKNEVILFHVMDGKSEVDFNLDNRPLLLVDMESGKELKIFPNEAKELYSQKVKDFQNDIRLKCAQYKIDYIEADISKGFSQVLQPYLLKRTKMY